MDIERNLYIEMRDKSAGEVEEIVKEALYEEDEERVYAEINQFLSINEVTGSPDEFHNLSVNFSRKDDYMTACKVLVKGLGKYPYSTDLLADFLQIGLYCNKEEECQYYYSVLLSIPKEKWTWRGFSFSIDYLQLITEKYHDEKKIEENFRIMLKIADEYADYFPYEEDVYLTKADIYKHFNQQKKEIECLKMAVDKKIKSSKCGLRLADFYFSKGDFRTALEYIERSKVESIDAQNKINVGYMYYLAGLCKTAILQMEKDFYNQSAVMSIYQDFYIAEETAENVASYAKNIRRQILILETKTGIKYDDAVNAQFNAEDGSTDNGITDSEPLAKTYKVGFPKMSLVMNKKKHKLPIVKKDT